MEPDGGWKDPDQLAITDGAAAAHQDNPPDEDIDAVGRARRLATGVTVAMSIDVCMYICICMCMYVHTLLC